jgi:hypothetical protein
MSTMYESIAANLDGLSRDDTDSLTAYTAAGGENDMKSSSYTPFSAAAATRVDERAGKHTREQATARHSVAHQWPQ